MKLSKKQEAMVEELAKKVADRVRGKKGKAADVAEAVAMLCPKISIKLAAYVESHALTLLGR